MKPKSNSTHSFSILFVEDDELVLKLQSTILAVKLPNVTIHTAIDGGKGLELFKEHIHDIVITDINMSEMCGVQMAENIRSHTQNTKLIAVTGKSCDSSENGKYLVSNSDGKTVEFDHVIVKPVDLSEMCGVIEQYIVEIEHRI